MTMPTPKLARLALLASCAFVILPLSAFTQDAPPPPQQQKPTTQPPPDDSGPEASRQVAVTVYSPGAVQ